MGAVHYDAGELLNRQYLACQSGLSARDGRMSISRLMDSPPIRIMPLAKDSGRGLQWVLHPHLTLLGRQLVDWR